MQCYRCGAAMDPGAAFCPTCGAKGEGASAPQYADTETVPNTAPQFYTTAAVYTQPAAQKVRRKMSPVAWVLSVTAVLLILGLAALNWVQFVRRSDDLARLSAMTAQRNTAEEQLSLLTARQEDMDAQVTDYEAQVAELKDKMAQLREENRLLEEELTAARTDLETLEEISAFLASSKAGGYSANADYYAGANVVVVPLGGQQTLCVTFRLMGNIEYNWDSDYVSARGRGFTDDVCPIVISGLAPGVSTMRFTNDVNNTAFEVLIVVVE